MKDLVFHIGHHKTATTWLQSGYFSEHPEVVLAADFQQPWNDEFLFYLIGSTERTFSVSRCQSIFEKQLSTLAFDSNKVVIVSAERLSGFPYSGGYDSYILANRIYSCFPESKIIVSIRNQIDMIISVYKQLVGAGYPGTFGNLINSTHWRSTAFSLDMYKYELLISKYFELFTKEKVLVLIYENLLKSKFDYVNQISSFLNIEYFEASNFNFIVGAAKPGKQILTSRLLNYFRKSEMNPFPLLQLNSATLNWLEKIIPVFLSDLRIDNGHLRYLKQYYAPSNILLRKLLREPLIEYP
jgi:hypothetical protein